MTRIPLTAAACAALFLTGLTPAIGQVASTEVMRLGLRGVYFVENQGQWSDVEVVYGFKSRGLDITFRESSFTMHLSRGIEHATNASRSKGSAPPRNPFVNEWEGRAPLHDEIRGGEDSAPAYEHLTLTVSFPGSNPVTPRGAQPQAAKFNYYIGDDESRWASNVPSFGAIIYESLYDGVDLHIRGNDDGVLKYEFHVAPGADYSQIRIAYDGIDSLCVEESGDLRITTSFGTLVDSAPLVWQEDAALKGDAREPREPGRAAPTSRDTIPARFELVDATTYRFALDGPVDPTRSLIIDPDVEWMYYLGGRSGDGANGLVVDSQGNLYVTGGTISADFEYSINTKNGEYDAYLVRIDDAGVVQWMTYFGGELNDRGLRLAIHSENTLLVSGRTASQSFPGRRNTFHGGEYDIFVATMDTNGNVAWMHYLGGSDSDYLGDIAVVSPQLVFVSGYTQSADFEGRRNAHHGGTSPRDAFVAAIRIPDGVEWMVYVGGSGEDIGQGIALDRKGAVRLVGSTTSLDFDGRVNDYLGGLSDAFVARLTPVGEIDWVTYLGGRRYDDAVGVDVNRDGVAFVAGNTWSGDFVERINRYRGGGDGFVAQVSPDGAVRHAAFLGGTGWDPAYQVSVDEHDRAIVMGDAASAEFPSQLNAPHGGFDGFILQLSPYGIVNWMLFIGGEDVDHASGDLFVDESGNAYLCGDTQSDRFESRRNSLHGSQWDGFVVKVGNAVNSRSVLTVSATCPNGGPLVVSWSGATSGGEVALLFARELGDIRNPVSQPCAGTPLGLGAIGLRAVFRGSAGPSGSRTLDTFAEPGACGGYLQLLDLSTCGTSNVARIE